MKLLRVLCLSVLLVGCAGEQQTSGGYTGYVKEYLQEHPSLPINCSTEGLTHRFGGAKDKGDLGYEAVPQGWIRIQYNDQDTAGFFKASPREAQAVLDCFDEWESHAPEVVYKSSGKYPRYEQRVIKRRLRAPRIELSRLGQPMTSTLQDASCSREGSAKIRA